MAVMTATTRSRSDGDCSTRARARTAIRQSSVKERMRRRSTGLRGAGILRHSSVNFDASLSGSKTPITTDWNAFVTWQTHSDERGWVRGESDDRGAVVIADPHAV